MLVRWPRYGFHCCKVTSEFTHGLIGVVNGPDIEFVVITARCQLLFIVRPFETTDLLLVVLEVTKVIILLSQVSMQNWLIFGARTQYARVPGNSANSPFMPLHDSHKLAFVDIPNLNEAAVRSYWQVLSSLWPAYWSNWVSWSQIIEFCDLTVASRPYIDTVW